MPTNPDTFLARATTAPSPLDLPAGSAEPSGPDVAKRRLERIHQHLVGVLEPPDTLPANLTLGEVSLVLESGLSPRPV